MWTRDLGSWGPRRRSKVPGPGPWARFLEVGLHIMHARAYRKHHLCMRANKYAYVLATLCVRSCVPTCACVRLCVCVGVRVRWVLVHARVNAHAGMHMHARRHAACVHALTVAIAKKWCSCVTGNRVSESGRDS